MQPDFRDAGSLDESSPTPLYLQLQHLIQQAVRSGKLRADEALPSERDLSRLLGISRVTVRKAIAGLVEKGMLIQRWGSGTFIAPAVQVALADWRIDPGAAAVEVDCSPVPGDCATPRGSVEVLVRVAVALPLLPPALVPEAPGTVPVDATALQRVSMFAAVP